MHTNLMPAPVLPKEQIHQAKDVAEWKYERPKRFWNPPKPQKCLLKPQDVINHITLEEYNDYEVLQQQIEDIREKLQAGSQLELDRKIELANMVTEVLQA